jgi:predicted phage baseplate assembly protein
MPLQTPNLDDRTFQDIVDEARTLIPRYCPEWTDHNLSDPGITLVELFAWMMEMVLFRLNQVPERNYVKFLDLMGVKLQEPTPARADVSFRLTAAQPQRVTIPMGTEVATVRTESQEAISFSTDRDLTIEVATLREVLVTREGSNFFDVRTAISRGQEVPVFAEPPMEGNALYIGHVEQLAGQTLALRFQCRMEGVGVDPRDPPLAWEAWSEDEGDWLHAEVESDTTGGLNRDGTIVLHIPYDATKSTINGLEASWVRCRLVRPRVGQRGYSASPQVSGLSTEIIGGTVPASHGLRLRNIMLGRSNGAPNQSFRLRNYPLLPRREGETLEVERQDGAWEAWQEVADFSESGPHEPHFVCDSSSGEIRFGPSLRQPDGTELQHGALPSRGAQLRFSSYRVGGGARGNVGRNTLTVLKSSIPYVSAVRNRHGAQGGRDGESLEQAKLRAPSVLRSRLAAITPADFEACALAASEEVARAHCLAAYEHGRTSAGGVTLLIVPRVHMNGSPVGDEELAIGRRLEERVREYVEARRPLTVEVAIAAPEYMRVGLTAVVRAKRGSSREAVEQTVRDAFYRYLHPTVGGPDSVGWPLERPLFAGELIGLLQREEGVDFVSDLQLRVFDPQSQAYGQPVTSVRPSPTGIVVAGACAIEVER